MTRPWWQPCTEEHYERKSYFPFDFFGRFPFGWMDNWYEHWGWIKREHPVKPIRDRPSYVVNTLTDSQEEMRELKGGQIVFDERRQKWYRVRKTVVPSNLSTGPVGLGDPDDKFLRRIEKNVLIPDMMAKRIEKVECRPEFMEYCRCMLDIGEYMGNPRCKPLLKKFQKCKIAMFRNADFWEKMKAEYLEGRAEMRRTGLDDKERDLMKYIGWKTSELEKKLEEKEKRKRRRQLGRE